MAMLAWPLASRADSMRNATWARLGSATVMTRTGCPAYSNSLVISPVHRSRRWRGRRKSAGLAAGVAPGRA